MLTCRIEGEELQERNRLLVKFKLRTISRHFFFFEAPPTSHDQILIHFYSYFYEHAKMSLLTVNYTAKCVHGAWRIGFHRDWQQNTSPECLFSYFLVCSLTFRRLMTSDISNPHTHTRAIAQTEFNLNRRALAHKPIQTQCRRKLCWIMNKPKLWLLWFRI